MDPLISSSELRAQFANTVVIDCRFSLQDTEQGHREYDEAHIPGAHYFHLDDDMSGSKAVHGGRHPLPDPNIFIQNLAALGIATDTPVVAYDNSRFAFASRLWWMLRALGYRNVQVLDGGFNAWINSGAAIATDAPVLRSTPVKAHCAEEFLRCIDFEGVRDAQKNGALLIDSREERRYQGIEEPVDPIAGHIPGALNYPWSGVTEENGFAQVSGEQALRWDALKGEPLVIYCGSGVTACVNLLSLSIAGRDDVQLYVGGWSDWCSRLEQ